MVDTSAWIEWLTGSPLGGKLGKEFPDKPLCIVPTSVQLALSKWLVRELAEEHFKGLPGAVLHSKAERT